MQWRCQGKKTGGGGGKGEKRAEKTLGGSPPGKAPLLAIRTCIQPNMHEKKWDLGILDNRS